MEINENSNDYKVFISYQDVDDAGVVFFANYFLYAEKARSIILHKYFSSINFINNQKWAIKKTSAEYYMPAKLGNTIIVKTKLLLVKQASFIVEHNFFIGNNHIAKIEVLLLSIDDNLKPAKLSKDIMLIFKEINY